MLFMVQQTSAQCDFTLSANVSNVSCLGAGSGAIDLTVNGGTPPFQFEWSNGVQEEDLLGVAVGTYTVTVTDGSSCTATVEYVVLADTISPVADAGPDTGIPCGGSLVTLNGSGSSSGGQYTYQWTTLDGNFIGGDNTINPIVIAGTYTLVVTDTQNACTQTDEVRVFPGPVIPAADLSLLDVSCTGQLGLANVDMTLGSGPYLYLWSNGSTQSSIINIFQGTYTVTVTDITGCDYYGEVEIKDTSTLTLSAQLTAPGCLPGNDGTIDLTATSLFGPFEYVWNTGETTEDLSNLTIGTYTVTVTYALATCTQTLSVNLANASGITINTISSPSACNLSNGSILVSTTGGIGPFTYTWSNGETTKDISNITAGLYVLTVTDPNSCTQTASVTVAQLNDISLTVFKNNVSCFGGNNGSTILTVTGGSPGYTYNWSNGSTIQELTNLAAGIYTVTVTDANQCSQIISVTITQPNPMVVSANVSDVICNGGSDGAIDLSVVGGTIPYSYAWSAWPGTIFATTQDLVGLPAGTYAVTVTDANFCTSTSISDINQPAPLSFPIITLSNDCSSETITGPNLPNVIYQWFGPNGFTANTAAITATVSGVYTLSIIDLNGCLAANEYFVNLLGGGVCGAITGRVFHDEDESCTLNAGEPGLAGWIVRAEGVNDTLYGVTNAQGEYLVGVPVGTYAMKVFVPNGLWTICPGGLMATVSMAGDTVSGGDFPVQSTFICPALTVSIGTNQLRRCFSNNFYQLEYCNQGTQAAQDAFVTVALDPFLTVVSASIPYTDLGANILRFEVGELEIGECGTFSIQVQVNCNASLGQTHCTEAAIYPDTLCVPPSASWSGASIQINSLCNVDSLRFVIQNVGSGGMNGTSGYIVVEDGIMFRSGTLPALGENDSMEIVVPANGSTWRVEVGQELFHPYPAPIGLSVEGCATTSSFSTGFVNQFPYNDEPPTVDIDCTPNIGSYDPNDKYGYPVGYGADHYIRPGTDIEYLVRFQNTGTDTAFTVRIVDTLSAWLDPATIRFGASSHPYTFDLNGTGVAHFLFENILLPDSNTNEVASHGFVKFNIKPRSDAPLETRIENTAAIYFDFNEPIFTNTTFHRLGQNFVTVGLWQALVPDAKVIAMPNPFQDQTILEVKGLARNTGLRLQVFDLRGKVVREMYSENEFFHLKKGDWPSGIYMFKITQNGKLVGSGKLMAE
jgi:uncharacterized repeat protein (TIGR01451 family)